MSISVIIPAYNEEKYISKIIRLVKKCNLVKEIIVVDNNSTDDTYNLAIKSGAKAYFCEEQGKGYAMEMGIRKANGDILVFLDGDICNYKVEYLRQLVDPILNDEADFVKSAFERTGGRVTELVAKPLLELTFPELSVFSQPLSGIIAGKRTLFTKLKLEKDYGVDIGILIDAYLNKERLTEVTIGKLKNCSQDWKSLRHMSKQVSKAILTRAKLIKKKNKRI